MRASGFAPLDLYFVLFRRGNFCATTMMEYGKRGGKRGNGEKEGLTELEEISANELVFSNTWWLKASRDGNADLPLWKECTDDCTY